MRLTMSAGCNHYLFSAAYNDKCRPSRNISGYPLSLSACAYSSASSNIISPDKRKRSIRPEWNAAGGNTAESKFTERVRPEYDLMVSSINTIPPHGGKSSLPICHGRVSCRRPRLKTHLEKPRTDTSLYCNSDTQRKVIRALRNDDLFRIAARGEIPQINFLQRAIIQLNQRISGAKDAAFLYLENDCDRLFCMFTTGGDGPMYQPKYKIKANMRASTNLYYDGDFEKRYSELV